MEFIFDFFKGLAATDWIVIIQTVAILLVAWFSWTAQKRDDFDWGDMLKNRYGKVDPYIVTYLFAFGLYSYIMIYLTRNNQLKEMYVILYLAYGLGMPFAKSILGAWRPPGAPQVPATPLEKE